MKFRITFSTNADEYYKENPVDVQLSMTVDSDTFEGAILEANHMKDIYVFWPKSLQVVSVRKLDIDLEEEVPIKEESFLTPDQWQKKTGIKILDPDGWRRPNDPSWWTPITRDEFVQRAMVSTCYAWPSPLWDEDVSWD